MRDSRDSSSGTTTGNNSRLGNGVRQAHRSLPTAGYLYQEKTNVDEIIDPTDMGLKVLQARRKGKLAKYFSPERYRTQIAQLMEVVTGKREHRPDEDLEMWGDSAIQTDSWPKVKLEGHLRILFYNVNGISSRQDYFEMDMLMQTIAQVQADITLISEVNLNLYKPRIRARLRESIRQFDKYAKVEMAYPPNAPFTSGDFNMGE